MSNIGIAANLFQPSGKCLKCRHWNPVGNIQKYISRKIRIVL